MRYTVHNRMTFKEFSEICRLFSEKDQDEHFSSKIAEFFPDALVLDFNMGRSALQHAFRMMGLRGKEVLLPAYSCPFFAELIMEEGVRPVFLDVDPMTFNVSPGEIEKKVSRKTAAVMLIHTYGSPCDLKPVLDLKEEYNFFLIEDCAHALGARYNGKWVGSFGDVSLFSMYKTVPNIGGAFLVINEKRIFKDFRGEKEKLGALDLALLSHSFGIAPDAIAKMAGKVFRLSRGFGARLEDKLVPLRRCNDFVKTIFNYYLDRIPERLRKKENLANHYLKCLRKINVVQPQQVIEKPAWMNFSIRLLDSDIRDALVDEMGKRGILCDRVWHRLPISSRSLQVKYQIKLKDYEKSLLLSRSIINLPLQHNFERKDVEYISDALLGAIDRLGAGKIGN